VNASRTVNWTFIGGYLQSSGYANVTGAVSTLTISHFLATTPNRLFVTTNNTGCGDYAITSVTATEFVVAFTVQPGTNEWLFYWYAEV
jgi:hypothetical protein